MANIDTTIARTRSSLIEAIGSGNTAEIKRLERYLRRLLFELKAETERHHLNELKAEIERLNHKETK